MTGSNRTAAAVRPVAEGGECRVSERYPCDVAATCQPPSAWKNGGRAWPARVQDMSTSGLCLVLGRRFEPGAGLAIEVPGADDGSSSTLLARVVHVRAVGGGSWALGCSLVSPLSDEELESLVGPLVSEHAPAVPVSDAPAAADRPFIADVTFRGARPDGATVERLIRKLYVRRPWPLPPGRTIGLRFQAFSNDPVVRVRVDACRSSGDRRVLECTFLDEAPPALCP